MINKIQAPKTNLGKNIRDGLIFAAAIALITFLQTVDTIDFAEYDKIVTAFLGFGISALNRFTR